MSRSTNCSWTAVVSRVSHAPWLCGGSFGGGVGGRATRTPFAPGKGPKELWNVWFSLTMMTPRVILVTGAPHPGTALLRKAGRAAVLQIPPAYLAFGTVT